MVSYSFDDEVYTEDPSHPRTSTDSSIEDSSALPPEKVTKLALPLTSDNDTSWAVTASSPTASVTPDLQDNDIAEPTADTTAPTTATRQPETDSVIEGDCDGLVETSSPEVASPIVTTLPLADKPKSVDPPAGRLAFYPQIFPGIGKVFALPSHLACDVDAFVDGVRRDPSNDGEHKEYEAHTYSSFPSTVTTSTGFSDDLEANASTASSLEGSAPLDANTDPFAPRVGKTLVWRNVNMTLVSRGYFVPD
jgi:hypothetical protein